MIHLVEFRILGERFGTRRVQIARHDPAPFLASRDRERPDPGERVAHDVLRVERVDESSVLRLQPRVPVDFRKVKLEPTIVFSLRITKKTCQLNRDRARREERELFYHFDDKVWFAGENLHLEIPVHVVDRVEFVDDRSQTLVFLSVISFPREKGTTRQSEMNSRRRREVVTHIEDHLTDEVFVRKVLVAEVQVSCQGDSISTWGFVERRDQGKGRSPMCPTWVNAVGDSSRRSSGRIAWRT